MGGCVYDVHCMEEGVIQINCEIGTVAKGVQKSAVCCGRHLKDVPLIKRSEIRCEAVMEWIAFIHRDHSSLSLFTQALHPAQKNTTF